MIEVHNDGKFWFATDQMDTLLSISKVIADFAKALNSEGEKYKEEDKKS